MPDRIEVLTSLGITLLKCGRADEAIPPLERAQRLAPTSLNVYAPLVTAYKELGRQSDAIATTERAVQMARSQGQMAKANQFSAWLADQRRSAAAPLVPRRPMVQRKRRRQGTELEVGDRATQTSRWRLPSASWQSLVVLGLMTVAVWSVYGADPRADDL